MRKQANQSKLEMPVPVEVRLSDVDFAPYNPRVMPAEKMRALKASLVRHGLVLNLVVQKKGKRLVLVGGHQRVRALRELCEERGWNVPETAWAIVLDLSDDEAKRLNVALNRIEGEFDPHRLGEVFAGMQLSDDDALAIGFGLDEIGELIKLARPPEVLAEELEGAAAELGGFAKSVTLTIEFDTVAQRDQAKEMLAAAAKARGKKAGAVLLAVLTEAKLAGAPTPQKVKAKANGKAARAN